MSELLCSGVNDTADTFSILLNCAALCGNLFRYARAPLYYSNMQLRHKLHKVLVFSSPFAFLYSAELVARPAELHQGFVTLEVRLEVVNVFVLVLFAVEGDCEIPYHREVEPHEVIAVSLAVRDSHFADHPVGVLKESLYVNEDSCSTDGTHNEVSVTPLGAIAHIAARFN